MIQTEKTTRHPLIPHGAMLADVEHIEFDIRTMFDYNVAYMQDRLIVTVHTDNKGDRPAYATMNGFADEDLVDVRAEFGPQLRRRVIDSALDLGYEADLLEESRKVRLLADEIALLRRPWWRKAWDHARWLLDR